MAIAKRLLGAVISVAVLLPGAALARHNVGLCGNYKQVASNAGDCRDCTLMIADNPEIQKYFVESNNGWSAETTWVEGDASVAEGKGKWNKGSAWAGKKFDLYLSQQGRTLTMQMTMRDRKLGTVEAKYKCTDY